MLFTITFIYGYLLIERNLKSTPNQIIDNVKNFSDMLISKQSTACKWSTQPKEKIIWEKGTCQMEMNIVKRNISFCIYTYKYI